MVDWHSSYLKAACLDLALLLDMFRNTFQVRIYYWVIPQLINSNQSGFLSILYSLG